MRVTEASIVLMPMTLKTSFYMLSVPMGSRHEAVIMGAGKRCPKVSRCLAPKFHLGIFKNKAINRK